MMQEGLSLKCSLEDLLQYITWYCDIASSKNLRNDIPVVKNPSEVHAEDAACHQRMTLDSCIL